MPLESRKRKKIFSFSERSNQSLSKYIPAENKIRKNENSTDFLLNTKHKSIFRPKFEELLWGICRIKSSAFNLKLCPPKLQILEVKIFRLKGKARLLLEYSRSGIYRSDRSQVFFKISVLKKFTIFTEKHLFWCLFSTELQASKPTTL